MKFPNLIFLDFPYESQFPKTIVQRQILQLEFKI